MADLHHYPCSHHVTTKRLVPGGRVAKEIETCARCDAQRSRSVGTEADGEWASSADHDANVQRSLDAESAARKKEWSR